MRSSGWLFGYLLLPMQLWVATLSLAADAGSKAAKPTDLTLYSYHTVPPFVVNIQQQTGLNYDLVTSLQQELGPDFRLTLQSLPRPLLNQRLAQGLPTIVLWANPAWFEQPPQRYLWTPALFSDREVFVSHYQGSRKIQQLSELQGLRVGTVRGYQYPGLEQLFASGAVRRVDSDSDPDNLAALLEQEIDYLVITRSSFLFFGRQPQFFGKLTITGQPYPAYQRQILLTSHYSGQHAQISAAVTRLQQQTHWQNRLDLYGLRTR